MEAREKEVRQPTMQASGGEFKRDGIMSLKEYGLVGGGKFTYMDKIKSAKKAAALVPLDTTFNEI
jgi:hypothetical protein